MAGPDGGVSTACRNERRCRTTQPLRFLDHFQHWPVGQMFDADSGRWRVRPPRNTSLLLPRRNTWVRVIGSWELLVERIAICFWRLRRILRYDLGIKKGETLKLQAAKEVLIKKLETIDKLTSVRQQIAQDGPNDEMKKTVVKQLNLTIGSLNHCRPVAAFPSQPRPPTITRVATEDQGGRGIHCAKECPGRPKNNTVDVANQWAQECGINYLKGRFNSGDFRCHFR